MSFTKCLRAASPFLTPAAKAALLNAARAQKGAGVSTSDAGRAAVQSMLDQTRAKLAADTANRAPLEQTKRGSFNPDTKTVTLLANADLSTFVHELGHFFLDTLAAVAAQPDAPQQVVDEMGTLLKWFGVPNLAAWQGMTLEQQRPHHEKMAEHFEAYIFEGKAPSAALKPAFQRLREFMLAAYKSLAAFMRGHNVKLTAEVRRVFDRMIATEAEIADAEEQASYRPLFKSAAEAEMTEDQYQDYLRVGAAGTEQAVVDMMARSERDLALTRSAHSKEAKRIEREMQGRRKEVQLEVADEVSSEPVYRAERWLTRGELTDGEGNEVKATKGYKLSTDGVAELFPPTALGNPDLSRIRNLVASTGQHPDTLAPVFGFADGREMINALIDRQPKAAVIEAETDARMLAEFGEMTTPAGIARAADAAVHNDARGRAIATDLKMLKDANTPTKKTAAGGSVNVLVKAAKEFAAQIANRTTVKKMDPRLHIAAERRAGALAAKSSDPAERIAAKRDQLLNFHAAQAVRDGADEVRAMRVFFARLMKGNEEAVVKSGRDPDVVAAARAILGMYGVNEKKGKTAAEYLETVKRHDPDMHQVLQSSVDAAAANAKPFTQLTLEEARALTEELQVLWVLSKRSRQMEVDGDLVDRKQVQGELKDRLVEIGVPDVVPGETHAVTPAERAMRHLKDFAAAARRVEFWVGAKDGDAAIGPFRKYVWQPVKEAAVRYQSARIEHQRKMRSLLQTIAPTLDRRIIKAPELGYEFGYSSSGSAVAEIVHAILHTGNESNKRKLLLGRNWATENGDGTLDTAKWDQFLERMMDEGVITKVHFDFAQGVWDLLEGTKGKAQETHRAVFGRFFKEVTADEFTNRFGSYRGGYVPAQTDAAAATDAAVRKLQEDENASMQFAFPTTNKGFTKSRVEYNSKLLLDLNALPQHIDKVLLFSYMEQPVRDVRRILTAPEVSQPLNRIDPSATSDMLTPWLNRAARQQVETPATTLRGGARLLSMLRRNVGAGIMFLNLINAAQQVTGLATAATKVQVKHLRRAAASWVASPMQTTRDVAAASVYMDQRLKDEMHTLTGEIQDILVNPGLLRKTHDWTLRNAYFLQRAVDSAISPIVWRAAYNQAIEGNFSEADAVRLADSAVRETQTAQAPEDIANIESGNAFVRMFTQFTGFFNMNANLMANEFTKGMEDGGLRKGLGRAVFVFPAVVLVPAIVGELISQLGRGGPGDDEGDGYLDDWFAAAMVGLAKYMAAMVPAAGGVLAAGIGQLTPAGYDDRVAVPAAVSAVERAVKLPKELAAAVAEGGHKTAIAVREVGSLLGAMGIIAAPAVAKRIAYGIDVAGGEVDPTGPIDAARGALTGVASPASKE